ncbi:unnamed protein product [Rotaria sordida]|uniref:Uncharacterized protein n=2 Tax=Rotaria sordida TaxID=392033 RepID=A0A815J5W6_9BILA|nr:unnamed protein product [Rotaria sordida]
MQSIPIKSLSLFFFCPCRSISSHIISTIIPYCTHNNNNYNYYPLLKQVQLCNDTCFIKNLSMNTVYDSKENYKSSDSCIPSEEEEEDKISFSRSSLICRRRQQKQKQQINSSNSSLASITSLKNSLTLLNDLFYYAKQNNDNNNYTTTLKSPHNYSIFSSKRILGWKQNDSGFQRDILVNDSNDDDDQQVIRSLSSSTTSTVDRFIRRRHRKQTRTRTTTTQARGTYHHIYIYFFSFLSSKLHLTMADSHDNTQNSNSLLKKKKSIRVFIPRRQRTVKRGKRMFSHISSSSINSHKTIASSSNNVQELVSLIEQKINNKKNKSRHKKNIIVVNYKPVFVNCYKDKSFQNPKSTSNSKSQTKSIHTNNDFSSSNHYGRKSSFTTATTTTTSNGSPLRSMSNSSQYQQPLSLDVPDVEDPLKFIEIMYQQLFTEDGRLRSEAEPLAFANCVQQIVTNSRKNSTSSAFSNRSTSSHLKPVNFDTNYQQRKFSSPSNHHPHHMQTPRATSLSSSPHNILNEHYDTYSEEEDEETQTFMQTNNPHKIIKSDNDISRKNTNNHLQLHTSSNSYHQKELLANQTTTTASNGFHISIDDTSSEDLDTFSDMDFMQFNNTTMQQSPSVDEDLTHTDSRLLSSGYQSLDRSRKSFEQNKSIILKSYSENDLYYLEDKNHIHHCKSYIRSSNIIVMPPRISTSLSLTNIIKRLQQPLGKILMKYVNFILITKNVLLLPLFIFLLRQRPMHIGI